MNTASFSDLGGNIWRIRRFADEADKRWSAFNPSIAYSPTEGYAVMFRSSNYFLNPGMGNAVPTIGSRIQNRLWIASLSKDFEVIESTMREVKFIDPQVEFKRGVEDARLYWRDGGWEFSAGLIEGVSEMKPRLAVFRINSFKLDGETASLTTLLNDGELQKVEKNWMPTYEVNPNFDFIYGPNSVYRHGAGPVEVREMTPEISKLRGGSPLWRLDSGEYLSILHKCVTKVVTRYNPRLFGVETVKIRSYIHCFAKYSYEGILTGVSDSFIFDEGGIEYSSGLVIHKEDVIVSYGKKDVASYLAKIKLSKVLEMIKDV
jgi:hypothetical protein